MSKPNLKDGWFNCEECSGSGDCAYCEGEGCDICDHSGQCFECHGSGAVNPDNEDIRETLKNV